MSERLRVGIAGLGRLGRHHAENLAQRIPRAELVAACSPVAEERDWAKRTLGVPRVHGSYEDLLAESDLQASQAASLATRYGLKSCAAPGSTAV